MRATAYIDCAARTCREIHDRLVELAASVEAAKAALPQLDPGDDGYLINEAKKNAYQRAINSMTFYAEHLEQPLWFQLCTSRLADPEGDLQTDPHSYVFPDPPDPGPGALRRLVVSNFKCLDLQCDVAQEDPTEGGGRSCFDNPNWSKQNVAPSVHGAGVPAPGSVVLTLDGADTELQYTGVALAYARVPDCPQGATCPFVITDLRLDLPPITYGPVTLTAPRVGLDRAATGAQFSDTVELAAGELALRVESPIELLGAPILDGAVVPLFVRNHGTVALQLTAEGLALEQARFNLFAGATAELRIGSTTCHES